MIYSIGVCDDEREYRELAEAELRRAACKCGIEIELKSFSSGKELLYYIKNNKAPDLLFLDIDMSEMNGMEAAKQIRELDEKQLIAFLTEHEEYVFESFKVQPFRFIRKHVMEMELFLALQAAVPIIDRRQTRYLLLKWENGEEMIDIMSICYAEILNRKIHFYLSDNRELVVKMTMSKLLQELREDDRFVLLDRGLLLNVMYVQVFERQKVTLQNGITLPIARTRQEEVRKIIIRNRRRL